MEPSVQCLALETLRSSTGEGIRKAAGRPLWFAQKSLISDGIPITLAERVVCVVVIFGRKRERKRVVI